LVFPAFGEGGTATLSKQPIAAWQDTHFARAAHDMRGTTFVAHVRYASTGAVTLANTHPFLMAGRLFAHNGVVQGLADLDRRLGQLDAADLVHGETDSERIFALITAETDRHRGDVTVGLTTAIDWISEHLPVYALNLVLATATDLWALRYPATHELYLLARPAGGTDARTDAHRALEATSQRIHVRSRHLADRSAVIVASEQMDDDPAWRLLLPGELLHIDADLSVHTSSPFRQTPRYALQLSDLSAAAAATQHPDTAGSG
jgi:glutamine amidotransferase